MDVSFSYPLMYPDVGDSTILKDLQSNFGDKIDISYDIKHISGENQGAAFMASRYSAGQWTYWWYNFDTYGNAPTSWTKVSD